MRWLLDQGLPLGAIAILNKTGQDSVHVSQIGKSGATDAGILKIARDDFRAVVTLDADFHALLVLSGETSPSVVRIREEGLKAGALAEIILRIADRFAVELNEVCLITFLKGTVRMRKIPFTG